MEMYLPEIALKQPKVDPRTVLLHKRNFLESSSDHIQEEEAEELHPQKMSFQIYTATDECDARLQQQQPYHTLESRLKSQNASFASSEATSTVLLSSSSMPLRTTTAAVRRTLSDSSSSLSTSTWSLHSTNLVNFYQTCHLYKLSTLHYFNDSLNYLYKLSQTKLLLVLLFICCAISSSYLPTTQAIPVRRTTASGQRLILHSNVYRERYHQNLLQDQKHHRQQQQQLLQKHQQYHQQLKYQQQQQHQQVQRPSSYLAPILRKVHHQLQHHHLHQRAAPTATTSNSSNPPMNPCITDNLFKQINNTLDYIKKETQILLETREHATFEEMVERWKLHELQCEKLRRKPVIYKEKHKQEMHDLYLNLHIFQQLADEVLRYTRNNKTKIIHDEEIDTDTILEFFETLKQQIGFNMVEAEAVLPNLEIKKPNLDDNKIDCTKNYQTGKLRDFLVIKEFMEVMQDASKSLETEKQKYCKSADNGKTQ